MNDTSLRFVNNMIAIFPALGETFHYTVQHWLPDDPPVTIAFAEIGQKMVEDFDSIDPSTKQALFVLIEEGMASQNEELGTAVATGLIEGMVGQASALGMNWQVFRSQLGLLSKAHADAWMSEQ